MSRIPPLESEKVNAKSRDLLGDAKQQLGKVPNILKTMAHSEATLGAYMGMSCALSKSSLSAELQEKISLALSQRNECDYCVAAHTSIAKSMGVDDVALATVREGEGQTTREDAAIQLALAVQDTRGFVSDNEIVQANESGITDAEICDIVTLVAKNIFANYFSHVAQTDIDFEEADWLDQMAVG